MCALTGEAVNALAWMHQLAVVEDLPPTFGKADVSRL